MQNATTKPASNFLDRDLQAELAEFEAEERARLCLPADAETAHWVDKNPQAFTAKQRAETTILHGGLTHAQDLFTQASLRSLGYRTQCLGVPDQNAFQFGREFGNRGQCNPAYFTVGNLIQYLIDLRDEKRIATQEIIDKYLFLTAGACGPCRFGAYVTEYRKALRDAGFDGFRVLLFQQQGGIEQAVGDELGLQIDRRFCLSLLKALVIGDVLNALMYHVRPYEVEAGATDKAVDECRAIIMAALEVNKGLVRALYRCRRILSQVKVDRSIVKPKVGIIGEFWAMTTEGDGNYQLQRFLESEGAEADIQLVTTWILYLIWQARYDTKRRIGLRGTDDARSGLAGVDVRKKLLALAAYEMIVRGLFQLVAKVMGLLDYQLPDMDKLAELSNPFYDNNLRGGEGHMEVGKLILNTVHSKVNMTLSVKPFGCMPSSSVSDGIQSLIAERYPNGIFLAVETNGDGAVSLYSRVQMQLFKAKQQAAREFANALERAGMVEDEFRTYLAKYPRLNRSLHRSRHVGACTAANLVGEVADHSNRVGFIKRRVMELLMCR